MKTNHNPGPMDAPPGLLVYAAGEDFPVSPAAHPLYCARCGFTHARPSGTGCMGVKPGDGGVLTREEAEVAAACVDAMLEDYEKLDPACPLLVWKQTVPRFGYSRSLDYPATDTRVAAARSALAKLREVAG